MAEEVSNPSTMPLRRMTPMMKYSNPAELTSLDARKTGRIMEMRIPRSALQ